jgi:pimeloyl-ACP methyl ester carboxylesterase
MNKEILYENRKIFYRTIGNGDPVMLVHGFGEDGNVFNKQAEFLKDEYNVIVPDLPGSGQSEMISDMSIEGMAEVLHAIIHEENIDTCVAIGHSMGGYITLALVEKYWNHLHAFGLLHSSGFADSEEKKVTRNKGIDFIKEHGAFEFLKTTTPNLFSQNTKDQDPDLVNDFIQSLPGFSKEALIAYYHSMMQRPDRTNVLKATSLPVLFVAGEQDVAIPFEDSLKQSHLAKKCFFHILNKSGHLGMLEEPTKMNQILKEFLLENYKESSR